MTELEDLKKSLRRVNIALYSYGTFLGLIIAVGLVTTILSFSQLSDQPLTVKTIISLLLGWLIGKLLTLPLTSLLDKKAILEYRIELLNRYW